MKISGFTFLRNTSKLYYPILESIQSALPIVDEFVIALGKGDDDDDSEAKIRSLQSGKIKIIYTEWDTEKYPQGMEHAHQTDIAKEACSGDWLLYLQGDELIHEQDYNEIKTKCKQYLNNSNVDGFLFNYFHFYGDYGHYFRDHCWYPYEIRIVRNEPEIHSFESAQSFRRIPNFDGISYRSKEGTSKLNVIKLNASIYHYGWVRPPKLMRKKRLYFSNTHRGKTATKTEYEKYAAEYDYGRMDYCLVFKQSHPKFMKQKITELDWQKSLRFSGPNVIGRPEAKHERLKYRLIVWIERTFFGGKVLGGHKNYNAVK
ncbi:MAG: Uncharacterised protein [Flavobacteriales bacterium]|nr:MAG: Uncharacterised protein [Flavobacteriales bacterium]